MHFVGILLTFLLGTVVSSNVNGYYHPSPRFFGSILSGTSSLSTAIRNKVTLTKRIKDILDDLEDLENDFERNLENLKEDFEEDLERLERRIDGDLDELKEDLQKEFEEDLDALEVELRAKIDEDVAALQEALEPECPTIEGTESKEIDGSCYLLFTTTLLIQEDALNACFNKGSGGKLAEPTNLAGFYAKLNAADKFQTQIAGNTIFLGGTVEDTESTYTLTQSGATGDITNTGGTAATALAIDGANGGALIAAAQDAPSAYLCQFDK